MEYGECIHGTRYIRGGGREEVVSGRRQEGNTDRKWRPAGSRYEVEVGGRTLYSRGGGREKRSAWKLKKKGRI